MTGDVEITPVRIVLNEWFDGNYTLWFDNTERRLKPSNEELKQIRINQYYRDSSLYHLKFEDIVEVIATGKTILPVAFMPYFSGSKAKMKFISQQLFFVDVDEEMTPREVIEICNNTGLSPSIFYYTFSHTPSKPRFRLVFILSRPVVELDERDLINKVLIQLLKSDSQCKDFNRLYHGTTREKVKYFKENLIKKEDILKFYKPEKEKKKFEGVSTNSIINNFDFYGFLEKVYKPFENGYISPCPMCGHNEDFAFHEENNCFKCYSSSDGSYGNIIKFLTIEKVDKTIPRMTKREAFKFIERINENGGIGVLNREEIINLI